MVDWACLAFPESQTLCQACVATSKLEGWQQYVQAWPEKGLPLVFPPKTGQVHAEDKIPKGWSWLFSHHFFAYPHHHECPDRNRWKQILCDPPEPPFLCIIAASGKKHLIFKAKISYSKTLIPVQLDDDPILLNVTQFKEALAEFEMLYHYGFSKDSILTGQYHNKTLLDVGLARWKPAEDNAKVWRVKTPMLWRLCHYIAQRPEGWEPVDRKEYETKDASPTKTKDAAQNKTAVVPTNPQSTLF
jgi:hypothetical protein